MKSKYRIVYKDERYWVQQKVLFLWFSMYDANFKTPEQAERFIKYTHERKKETVVKTFEL